MRALLLVPFCLLVLVPLNSIAAEPKAKTKEAAPDKDAPKDASDKDAAPDKEVPKDAPDRAKLIEEFEKTLNQATLVGYFTNNEKPDAGLKSERYKLGKVKKLRGDNDRWVINYQYGDEGPNIPLTLDIKWAEDTPMISLTDMEIPGVGTFSARVLFYRGEYAGTWSASDHGGHLFGKIEKKK